MNVLEKILEEIEQEAMTNKEIGRKQCEGMIKTMDIIRSHINEVENDGWIPVEERLPEDLEEVLVWYEYFRYGEYNCMFQTHGIAWQLDGHWSADVPGRKARCIAWQPLPKPYNEGKRIKEFTEKSKQYVMDRFTTVV